CKRIRNQHREVELGRRIYGKRGESHVAATHLRHQGTGILSERQLQSERLRGPHRRVQGHTPHLAARRSTHPDLPEKTRIRCGVHREELGGCLRVNLRQQELRQPLHVPFVERGRGGIREVRRITIPHH